MVGVPQLRSGRVEVRQRGFPASYSHLPDTSNLPNLERLGTLDSHQFSFLLSQPLAAAWLASKAAAALNATIACPACPDDVSLNGALLESKWRGASELLAKFRVRVYRSRRARFQIVNQGDFYASLFFVPRGPLPTEGPILHFAVQVTEMTGT